MQKASFMWTACMGSKQASGGVEQLPKDIDVRENREVPPAEYKEWCESVESICGPLKA